MFLLYAIHHFIVSIYLTYLNKQQQQLYIIII